MSEPPSHLPPRQRRRHRRQTEARRESPRLHTASPAHPQCGVVHAVQQATHEQAPAEHSQAGTPGCGGALRACSARNSARFMKRLDSEAVMHLASVPHGCPAVYVARYVGR